MDTYILWISKQKAFRATACQEWSSPDVLGPFAVKDYLPSLSIQSSDNNRTQRGSGHEICLVREKQMEPRSFMHSVMSPNNRMNSCASGQVTSTNERTGVSEEVL